MVRKKAEKVTKTGCCCSLPAKGTFYSEGVFCANGAFTIIELLVVLVVLGIASMMVVPMFSSAGSVQVRSAANMVAADLEYAKSMAISRQGIYAIVFDKVAESYQIEDGVGVIDHPVKKGFQYVVNFGSGTKFDRVDLSDAAFDGTQRIEFDYLGSPDNGGTVTLEADGMTVTINIADITGFITVSN